MASLAGPFAVVRYVSDNVVEVVPTTYIENFQPSLDFDHHTVYWVKYKVAVDRCPDSAESSTDEGDSHKAVILTICQDREEAKNFRMEYLRSDKRLSKPIIRYYEPRKRRAEQVGREVAAKTSRKVKQGLAEAAKNQVASRVRVINKILKEKEEKLKAKRRDNSEGSSDEADTAIPQEKQCGKCQEKAWLLKCQEKKIAALKSENELLRKFNDSLSESSKVLQQVVEEMVASHKSKITKAAGGKDRKILAPKPAQPPSGRETENFATAGQDSVSWEIIELSTSTELLQMDGVMNINGETENTNDVEDLQKDQIIDNLPIPAVGSREPIWAEANGKVHWGWGHWVLKKASDSVLAQQKIKRVAGDATRVLLGTEAKMFNYTGFKSAKSDPEKPNKKPFPDSVKNAVEAVMLKWCEVTQQPNEVVREIRMCSASQGYKAAMTQVGITMAKSETPGFSERKKLERLRRAENAATTSFK